jgi:hypothetical protein
LGAHPPGQREGLSGCFPAKGPAGLGGRPRGAIDPDLLAMGYLSTLFGVDWRARHGAALNSFVLTGVLGGYTTFSTMQLEAVKADSAAILDALDAMAQSMAKNEQGQDTAVILVSSHGEMIDGQFYLIPYGFDPGSQGRSIKSGVSASEFAKKVGALAGHGKVLLLLDACHSGAVGAQAWAKDPDAKILQDAMDMENVRPR